jgi:hypothetical protein
MRFVVPGSIRTGIPAVVEHAGQTAGNLQSLASAELSRPDVMEQPFASRCKQSGQAGNTGCFVCESDFIMPPLECIWGESLTVECCTRPMVLRVRCWPVLRTASDLHLLECAAPRAHEQYLRMLDRSPSR